MAQSDVRPTGGQEIMSLIPTEADKILLCRLIIKNFYGHSLPSTDPRGTVVSF